MTAPRFAIVFKTHFWDGFAQRQFNRYARNKGSGEIFVYIDETNGRVEVPDGLHVVRSTNADLIADGFAERYERGSLLWWNTDYPNYYVQARLPAFDYYLFVEYDSCLLGSIESFVGSAAERGADVVALPTRTPLNAWMWTRFHAQTYPRAELAGSLNCISLYSARALTLLGRRRREMAEQSGRGEVAFWPGNEVFIATEAKRAGLRLISLEAFGNADGYEWHPPHLEEALPAENDRQGGAVFLHPVLDRPRYIASLLRFENDLTAYFRPGSALRRELARFPGQAWRPHLAGAFGRRLRMRARERLQGLAARLRRTRDAAA